MKTFGEKIHVEVLKKPSDPRAVRVSCGAPNYLKELGVYCVYRGNINDAIFVLEESLSALKSWVRQGLEPEEKP